MDSDEINGALLVMVLLPQTEIKCCNLSTKWNWNYPNANFELQFTLSSQSTINHWRISEENRSTPTSKLPKSLLQPQTFPVYATVKQKKTIYSMQAFQTTVPDHENCWNEYYNTGKNSFNPELRTQTYWNQILKKNIKAINNPTITIFKAIYPCKQSYKA